MAGLWEFPGGKIKPGESPESALIRELKEELGLELEPGALKPLSFASHAYQDFHLLMPVFTCCAWRGEVRGREGQATKWVKAEALEQYPMPPADAPIIPLVRKFIEDLAD